MASLPPPSGVPAPSEGSQAGIRVGQVFLDVRRRHLSYLDQTSRQLHKEGIPYTPSDLEAHPLQTLTGESVLGRDLPLVIAWREGKPVEASFIYTSPQGIETWLSWCVAPIHDREGKLLGITGTIRCGPREPDWQVLAGLAHDLRTPLNAITLQVAVLNHLAAANPDLSKMLGGIQSSAERALRVGLDLLSWCRRPGERGRGVEARWFPLEPLLAELGSEQSLAAKNKSLTLHCDFSSCAGWEVYSDRIRLGRLLGNLLVNAVRYTARGRVAFTTSWREEGPSQALAVGVKDTGDGFSPEEQESIFQPYERGKAGKESDSGGSGLGLAVVDRLVAELGVELDVYSEHGRGSTFHLLLPVSLLRNTAKVAALEATARKNQSDKTV